MTQWSQLLSKSIPVRQHCTCGSRSLLIGMKILVSSNGDHNGNSSCWQKYRIDPVKKKENRLNVWATLRFTNGQFVNVSSWCGSKTNKDLVYFINLDFYTPFFLFSSSCSKEKTLNISRSWSLSKEWLRQRTVRWQNDHKQKFVLLWTKVPQ